MANYLNRPSILTLQQLLRMGMKVILKRKGLVMKEHTKPSPMMERVLYLDIQFLHMSSTTTLIRLGVL